MSNIRNFCIIAHVDHGKSTLADRLLQITNTVDQRQIQGHEQYLDNLELERERGITIKLRAVRMNYFSYISGVRTHYILNLIDTPGHVDFSYEVSRSMAACEGALLLVDATQGVEAQTLSNAFKAIDGNLVILPVINKIDLPNANVKKVSDELFNMFGFKEQDIISVSSKTGYGISNLLDQIILKIPSPQGDINSPLQALVFDAFYDDHKGVVVLVKVFNGVITQEDVRNKKKILLKASGRCVVPLEIGYLSPDLQPNFCIKAGEVGYIATGLKDIRQVYVGDTIVWENSLVSALPGYKKIKPMVFAGLYPTESDNYEELRDAIEKLALNDAAISYEPEYNVALGAGFRCGFLGLLHMEIVQERLEREYGVNLIVTTPSVEYKVQVESKNVRLIKEKGLEAYQEDGKFYITVKSAAEFPDESVVLKTFEPWVKVEIVTVSSYIGAVMQLCQNRRGIFKNMNYLDSNHGTYSRVILDYEMPFAEIINNFFDNLKAITHGYSSVDYQFIGYREGDIVKLSVMVHGKIVEALSLLVERARAYTIARDLADKLRNLIPRHQFKIAIQVAIGSRVLARTDIPAYRKDVTKGLSGGDHRRKMKHLERQKEGKKRMKMLGQVSIPQEAFLAILKKDD